MGPVRMRRKKQTTINLSHAPFLALTIYTLRPKSKITQSGRSCGRDSFVVWNVLDE